MKKRIVLAAVIKRRGGINVLISIKADPEFLKKGGKLCGKPDGQENTK